MFFNTPLPPQRFWKRWINGCTITEAFLYIWIVAIEVLPPPHPAQHFILSPAPRGNGCSLWG